MFDVGGPGAWGYQAGNGRKRENNSEAWCLKERQTSRQGLSLPFSQLPEAQAKLRFGGGGGGCLDFRNWSLNRLNAPFGGLGGALKRGDRSETAGAGWTLVTTT